MKATKNPAGADGLGAVTTAISRRGAIGLMAAAAAAPLSSNAYAAAQPLVSVRYVLTDKRHPESLMFAAAFTRQGVERLEVTDGLTRLWREKLAPLWSAKQGAIVGLTERETWVCIAEQARGCGRPSLLSGRHSTAADGQAAEHYLTADPPTLRVAAALEGCGGAWPSVMAGLAAKSLETPRSPNRDARFVTSDASRWPVSSAKLASWVIG